MSTFKQYIKLGIAFALGALITYLAMSLHTARQELKTKTSETECEAKLKPHPNLSKQQPEEEREEEKYWLDERIEQQNAETKERIKQQQSKGDDLKSSFEQFIK